MVCAVLLTVIGVGVVVASALQAPTTPPRHSADPVPSPVVRPTAKEITGHASAAEPSAGSRSRTATTTPASRPSVRHRGVPHSRVAPHPAHRTSPAPVPPGTVVLPHGGRAHLVHQSVGDDGELPIPHRLDQAAWWGAGVHQRGAMLLSGHINWKGQIGPFDELWKDHTGQSVMIVDPHGHRHQYRIRQVLSLSKTSLPRQAPRLFSQSGPHRLVLVTCGGRFVGGAQGYNENRIVIARAVSTTRP